MRAIVAIALLAALTLAGCTSKPQAPTTTSAPSTSGALAEAGNGGLHLLKPTPKQVSVSFDANLGTYVCVPAGPDSCMGTGTGSTAAHDDRPFDGALSWTGNLTMTWTTQNPTMQKLAMSFGPYQTCGQGCSQSVHGVAASGPSPLRLSIAIPNTGADKDGYYISVNVPRATPSPIYAVAQSDTAVHVEGTLTATVLE